MLSSCQYIQSLGDNRLFPVFTAEGACYAAYRPLSMMVLDTLRYGKHGSDFRILGSIKNLADCT